MNEKSQVQALDRTQPPLPLRPGQVERFFPDLTDEPIRRGILRSTSELEQAITEYIETVNERAKPFQWHKTTYAILAPIKRLCLRMLEATVATASTMRTQESRHWISARK